MTDERMSESQLREVADGLGYRLWARRTNTGAVIYHVNHSGNHDHAHGLRSLEEVEHWLGSAEPARDDCPHFEEAAE